MKPGNLIFAIVLCLLIFTPAFARDFRPDGHLENIPLTDSSIQQCYVFRTTAGVRYTVESSDNLSNWTSQDEIYGLGNEYVVTMREYTPPPPPPPGTPPAVRPPRAINTSLRLQRASGAAGGTVVSWPSLDHGGPVVVRVAVDMDPGWNQIPLYSNRFEGYYFFIWHPWYVVAPPAANPILGPNDSALLAVLEASLPAMNQQVADSVFRARNAPQPPPEVPGAKRFWRVKVDPDIDTDSDGSPDWAEFEIAARGTGNLFPGVIGDAFDPDTNGDGIPDGQQLDADGDGTPDSKDPDSTDNTSVVPLGPIPRYALFEISGNALQINDLGTVIFPTKVWKAGVLTDLPGGGAGAPTASARAINDLDVILGTVGTTPDLADHPSFVIGNICYWPTPTSPYKTIHVIESGVTVDAYRQHDGIYQQGPAPVLTNSGHFIAHANVVDPPDGYTDAFDWNPTLWQIPIGTAVANRQESPAGAAYLSSPSLTWGTLYPRPANGHQGVVYAPAALPSIPFVPLNVISQPLPKGGTAIFATPPLNLFGRPNSLTTQVYVDGKWRENELYANAIDIAADGTAIGKNLGARVAPILLNDQWTEIDRTAPGAPAAWLDPFIKLIDTTPHGWVLARDTVNSKSAVMLPIRAEGYYTQSNGVSVTSAVGVDDFSIGSNNPGDAVQDRIWIMAPLGTFSKIVKLKAPLNGDTPLKLEATGVNFGTQDSITVSGGINPLTIRADETATTGQEVLLDLTMGQENSAVASLSKPVGFKVMKERVVKVTVYQISRKLSPTGTPIPTDADIIPAEGELENFLKDLYRPQINVTFDVTFKDPAYPVQWDTNSNATLDDSGPNAHSPDQEVIMGATAGDTTPSNIKVFLVSSERALSSGANAAGMTSRTQKTCWVLGSKTTSTMSKQSVMETIGHEIGHIFVDYGHPDKKAEPGHAPLPGTKNTQRLMCSGKSGGTNSRLLVKGEWDEAEKWLKVNVDGQP